MNIDDVKRNAFAMPLTSPDFSPDPYRFMNREFLIVGESLLLRPGALTQLRAPRHKSGAPASAA